MSKNAKQAALTLVTPVAERQTEEVVREQAPTRRIPGKKVGGQWRFSRASLERYLGVPEPVNERRGKSRYVDDDRGCPKD